MSLTGGANEPDMRRRGHEIRPDDEQRCECCDLPEYTCYKARVSTAPLKVQNGKVLGG